MLTTDPRARAGAFVGRAEDLAALDDLVRSGNQRVVYLHGVAGIGKSMLVGALAEQLGETGIRVVRLDCRAIEPTERGLFAALGTDGLESFVRELGAGQTVVVLDHYEVFRLMDTWLRQVLVPALPKGTCVLLCGREQPVAAWFSIGGFRGVPLGPLSAGDAALLLETFDIGADGIGEDAGPDGDARELVVRGERVALTPLEFGLFDHLRQCEGKAVSRQELLRDVWGTDYTGGSNVVDAMVRSLRRKLGDAAAIVETVRGSGYRLRVGWHTDLR